MRLLFFIFFLVPLIVFAQYAPIHPRQLSRPINDDYYLGANGTGIPQWNLKNWLTYADTSLHAGQLATKTELQTKLGKATGDVWLRPNSVYKIPNSIIGTQPLELFNIGGWFQPGYATPQMVPTGFGKNNWSIESTWNVVWDSAALIWKSVIPQYPQNIAENGWEGYTFHTVAPGEGNLNETWSRQLQVRPEGVIGTPGLTSGHFNQSFTTMYWKYKGGGHVEPHPWMGGSTKGNDPFIWMHSEEVKGTTGEYMRIEQNSGTASGGQVYFRKSRGSYASKAVSNSGDQSGIINFTHWDGSAYLTTARMMGQADATATAGNIPQSLIFQTSNTDASGLSTRLRIWGSGRVQLPQLSGADTRLMSVDSAGNVSLASPTRFRLADAAIIDEPDYTGVPFIPALPTGTFFLADKWSNFGGVQLSGFTEAGVNDGAPLALMGYHGGTSPTTEAVRVVGYKHNGTTGRTTLGNSESVFGVYNGTSQLFAIKGNGTTIIPSLAGTGTRGLGVDASGNLVIHSETGSGLTINNNVDGRVVTVNGSTTSLDGESGLTFNTTTNPYTLELNAPNTGTGGSTNNGSFRLNDADVTPANFTGLGFAPNIGTNTAGVISVAGAANGSFGGMSLSAFTSNSATALPMIMTGYHGSTAPTTGAVIFRGAKHNGTTGATTLGNSELVTEFRNWTTTVATIKGNGDLTTTGSITGSVSALGSAASTFLTHTSGLIQSRTAAQVRSDIGAAPATSLVVVDDADYTVAAGVTDVVYSNLTAARTVTISPTTVNQKIRVRNGGGIYSVSLSPAFSLSSSSTLNGLATGKWAEAIWDGTTFWVVAHN